MNDDTLTKAAAIGAEHAANAVGWFLQDTIGGRASGDVRERAAAILAGINDGDPAILDGLPAADLSGQWADTYTLLDLAEELDVSPEDDCIDDIATAYEDGFNTAAESAVAAACESVLD
jgi:hypothetical protein